MRLDEISFDQPWKLVSGTPYCDYINQEVRKYIPRGLIQVWEKVRETPQEDYNILVTFQHNGAWEVHHVKIDTNGKIYSGQKDNTRSQQMANIGYVSTAKQIYEKHLSRGRKIRVSSTLELWSNYEKFINKIIRDSDYRIKKGQFNLNDISFDGKPCVSQIIEHQGKFLNGSTMLLNNIYNKTQ